MTRTRKQLQKISDLLGAARAGLWGRFQIVADRTVWRLLKLPYPPDIKTQKDSSAFKERGMGAYAWRDKSKRVHLVVMIPSKRRAPSGRWINSYKSILVSLWEDDVISLWEDSRFTIHELHPDPTRTDGAILGAIREGAPEWWEDVVHLRKEWEAEEEPTPREVDWIPR